MADDLRKLRPTPGGETPFRVAWPAPTRSLSFLRQHAVITLAVLLLVMGTVVDFGLSHLRSDIGAPTIESLAVLPLDNVGDSTDTE